MSPAQLLAGFQSLPLLPTSKLGPSSVDHWVVGFVYILGPGGWVSLMNSPVMLGIFLAASTPLDFFGQMF